MFITESFLGFENCLSFAKIRIEGDKSQSKWQCNKNLDKFIRAAFHQNRHITRRCGTQYYRITFLHYFQKNLLSYYESWLSRKLALISPVSTNSIDPFFGDSGIFFFFFAFFHILKVPPGCCLNHLTLHFWYLIHNNLQGFPINVVRKASPVYSLGQTGVNKES